MQKRVISGILALALVLTLTLTLAQADVRVELDGIDGGSASVTASEDDSAALLEGYLYQLNGLDVPEVVKEESSGNTASRPAMYAVALNEVTNNIYRRLVPEIKKIAAGESASATIVITDMPITYTQEDLGHITIIEGDALSEAAGARIGELFGADVNHDALLSKLLANMPYELYWFDKTNGMAISYGIEPDENTVTIPYIVVGFCVADTYRDTTKYLVDDEDKIVKDEDGNPIPDYTAINTTKTGAATAAAAKAAEVVAKNQGKGTYSKLVAYREFITDAVEYNKAASKPDYPYGYGDPWQLIYVFDGDPDTNVVCEGYSKAFKYLCDLTWTGSDPEVACYLPTGTMDGDAHMWNIVSIGGVNYLTDITNCDSGTIGAPDQLFLCGAEGSVDASYAAATTGGAVTYVYDKETLALYDKELVLSATKYSPLAFSLDQLTELARYAAGITTDEVDYFDVNNDGIISAADLTAMAQSLAS